MKLSVIIIARNQAWNISRLIDSVLRVVPSGADWEVMLVDSASTDDTIAIANLFPIRILKLRADGVLTAGAGRHVGFRHSAGEFVLFLDGDMEVVEGWVPRALREMECFGDVAAVGGYWIDLPKETRAADPARVDCPTVEHADADALHVGGPGMYRRTALDFVGSFNPYLHSDEEPELCLRLRHAGYRIRRIGYPIAYHYTDPAQQITTLFHRWRRNLWLGTGQSLRHHVATGLFVPYALERGFGCIPLIVFAVGVVMAVIGVRSHHLSLLGGWVVAVALGLAVHVRRAGAYRTLYSLIQRVFLVDGTIRGFLMRHRDPDSYPLDVDIVK